MINPDGTMGLLTRLDEYLAALLVRLVAAKNSSVEGREVLEDWEVYFGERLYWAVRSMPWQCWIAFGLVTGLMSVWASHEASVSDEVPAWFASFGRGARSADSISAERKL